MAGDLILPVGDSEDERQSSSKAAEAMAVTRLTLCSSTSFDGWTEEDEQEVDGQGINGGELRKLKTKREPLVRLKD